MPKIEDRKPRRETLPITAGRMPQWDLSEVETDYLVAELIRRGFRLAPAKVLPSPPPRKARGR